MWILVDPISGAEPSDFVTGGIVPCDNRFKKSDLCSLLVIVGYKVADKLENYTETFRIVTLQIIF
jgi:hypothetical protein